MDAFRKVESKARKSYYYYIPGEKYERDDIRVNPLVTDFNPGLPNIVFLLLLEELKPSTTSLCTVNYQF